MRTLTYVVAVSLDGFVCAPDGSIDFFPDGNIDFHINEIPELIPNHIRPALGLESPNRRFDTMLQGRGSYDIALREGITRPYAHMREYVFSRTLSPDIAPEVTIVHTDPLDTVRGLKAEDGPLGVCLVGGPTIAGLLLPEIDEILIKRYPVVAGAGRPMFESGVLSPESFSRGQHHSYEDGSDYSWFHRAAPSVVEPGIEVAG
ncbi:MAG: dihydrofolate reductase family protein [Brevibacterium sp.]